MGGFTLTLGPPLNLPLGGGGRWLEGEGTVVVGGVVVRIYEPPCVAALRVPLLLRCAAQKGEESLSVSPLSIASLVSSEISECFVGEETYAFRLWHCEVACEREGDGIGFVGTLATG